MSEERHETLSAFIDGELADEKGSRIVDEVLSDTSLTRLWSSYHLIGEVMRRHSHGVRRVADAPGATVTPIASSGRRGSAIRPVAGLALAASVAVAAVIGLYSVSTPGPQPPVQLVADDSPSVVQARLPESRPVAETADIQRLTWNDADPGVANRLNGYLLNHNEYLANGMRGMLPYARIVAYESGQPQ